MNLYQLARTRLGKNIIGTVFNYMSDFLPINKLCETENLMAFYHPEPSYPVHILLVPKIAIQSLNELDQVPEDIFGEVLLCVKELVEMLALEPRGYRLIINGGKYQEIPQLHFHLVSE